MNLADNIKNAIRRLHITTDAETDKRILDDAYSALDRVAGGHVGGCVWHSAIRRKAKDLIPISVVILVFFTLFFCTLNTRAVVLEDVYKALEQARNVCIERFRADEQEPYQTSWISRPLNIWFVKDKKLAVLWDFNNSIMIESNRGLISKSLVETDKGTKLQNSMGTSFGLAPFSDALEAKTKGRWEQVVDAGAVAGVEVYDLVWTQEASNGMPVYYKWRVFVDIHTDLPVRTQWYQKIDVDKEYELTTTSTMTYPTNFQIESVIQDTFGSSLSRLSEPENIEVPQNNKIETNIP